MSTVTITPVIAPQQWRDAIASRGIQGVLVDERGRFQLLDEGQAIRTLMGDLMTAHVERTIVLPSHATSLRQQVLAVRELNALAGDTAVTRRRAAEIIERLESTIRVLEGGTP